MVAKVRAARARHLHAGHHLGKVVVRHNSLGAGRHRLFCSVVLQVFRTPVLAPQETVHARREPADLSSLVSALVRLAFLSSALPWPRDPARSPASAPPSLSGRARWLASARRRTVPPARTVSSRRTTEHRAPVRAEIGRASCR